MQESVLYERWQQLALSGETIHYGGRSLQVLQSGRLNTARGPDFRSARFRLDGVVFQGDVECHLKYQDWYHHQHHLDPAFADVLLHIVNASGTALPPVHHEQSAISIPTIPLPVPTANPLQRPCSIRAADLPLLNDLALKRLRLKEHLFQSLLQSFSVEQIFYEYFLRALGYSANSGAFQLLARRLPWSWLSRQSRQDTVCAVYAGTAGFLPYSSSDKIILKLSTCYKREHSFLDAAPLDSSIWQFAGIRPSNHPHFRLAGWVHFFFSLPETPFQIVRQILSSRLPFKQAYAQLQAYLHVPCPPYWQTHYGFGLQRHSGKARSFLGPSRIGELLINLILPLFRALAQGSGSHGFVRYLENFYLYLPAYSGYTYFKQFKLPVFQNERPTLALYQGLFYLEEYYCRTGKCAVCPLNQETGDSRPEIGNNF